MWLQRDAEPVPEIRECSCDQKPLHVSNGIGTCNKYENNPTPKIVTNVAKRREVLSVAARSPIADTNTHAKMPGISPK
jgi:hypothetical protein